MIICYSNNKNFAARISLNRRMPTCYLLSNKLILLAAILVAFYFITMDSILLIKAKNRGPFAPIATSTNAKKNQLLSSPNETSMTSEAILNSDEYFINPRTGKQLVKWQYSLGNHPTGCIFWPLPIKKIMMAQTTHYIRSPLAEFVEYGFGFSHLFPFVNANSVSLVHCILSLISVRFLIQSSLFLRQIGVALFQFRNFLDSFDGVIYRAQAKNSSYKSHYGSMGYFVDAFSDVFGGSCLIFAIAIYLIKHPPLKRSLTQCFRLSDDQIKNSAAVTFLLKPNNLKPKTMCSSSIFSKLFFNTKSEQQFLPLRYSLNSFNINRKSCRHENSGLYASSIVILASVGLLALRLAVSGLFWDRSLHNYEKLLDSQANNQLHQVSLIDLGYNHFQGLKFIIFTN
jgi:hypothetical protein